MAAVAGGCGGLVGTPGGIFFYFIYISLYFFLRGSPAQCLKAFFLIHLLPWLVPKEYLDILSNKGDVSSL
jgi:hypothetical protein